ncbi:MAG: DUF424 family protein [Ignisphaera sp.]|nr:DUF424 family protein [Ignisphaera sp.]
MEGVTMVAVCDEEILGKVFREGDIVLNISSAFYEGKRVGIEEVIEVISTADMVIVSGKRIVNELARRGLAPKEYALEVDGQLHLQIIRGVYE